MLIRQGNPDNTGFYDVLGCGVWDRVGICRVIIVRGGKLAGFTQLKSRFLRSVVRNFHFCWLRSHFHSDRHPSSWVVDRSPIHRYHPVSVVRTFFSLRALYRYYETRFVPSAEPAYSLNARFRERPVARMHMLPLRPRGLGGFFVNLDFHN
jgi:hypothetical protein